MPKKRILTRVLYLILFFELIILLGAINYRRDLINSWSIRALLFDVGEKIHANKLDYYKSLKGSLKCPDCNVVLIVMEVARPDHFSCYGYYRNTTPNIDRLANHGILFENAFSQASWTLPSHMSMLTSLYPSAHGVTDNQQNLSSDITTLPQILKRNGFATAGVVSHFNMRRVYGFDRGFDYYQDNASMMEATADRVNEQALEWLNQNFNKQFFLYLFYFDVHLPYTPPKPFDTKFGINESNFSKYNYIFPPFNGTAAYRTARAQVLNTSDSTIEEILGQSQNNRTKRRRMLMERFNLSKEQLDNLSYRINLSFTKLMTDFNKARDLHNDKLATNAYNLSERDIQHAIALYDGEIAFVDYQLGQLLKRLEELNLMENTIIIITSGHGEFLGENGLFFFNHNGLNDRILHVPLAMYIPQEKTGKRVRPIVSNIDVYPTILELLGIEKPSDIQGISLLPLIEGNSSVDSYAIAESQGLNESCTYVVRTENWKIVCGAPPCQLYNLEDDPNESVNVNASYPYVVDWLKSVYHKETRRDNQSMGNAVDIDEQTKERLRSEGYWK
jgi:arylsulfatase A-like enzyme